MLERLEPAPLRHACTRCGGSCQGITVRLLDADEHRRVHEAGVALGVPDPTDGDALRTRHGACVFQAADGGCRVHERFGFAFKPRICRQFPLIAVKVGASVRVGLDPGCYASLEAWVHGPEVEATDAVSTTAPASPQEEAFEEAFLDDSEGEDVTLDQVVAWLVRAPTQGTPQGLVSRWVRRMRDSDLRALLELPDTSPALRHALGPVLDAAQGWDPASPPHVELDRETERHVIASIRQIVWLRLGRSVPMLPATVLLLALGARACAWTDPRPERFGVAWAAWIRAVRARVWWMTLIPDEGTLRSLLSPEAP